MKCIHYHDVNTLKPRFLTPIDYQSVHNLMPLFVTAQQRKYNITPKWDSVVRTQQRPQFPEHCSVIDRILSEIDHPSSVHSRLLSKTWIKIGVRQRIMYIELWRGTTIHFVQIVSVCHRFCISCWAMCSPTFAIWYLCSQYPPWTRLNTSTLGTWINGYYLFAMFQSFSWRSL